MRQVFLEQASQRKAEQIEANNTLKRQAEKNAAQVELDRNIQQLKNRCAAEAASFESEFERELTLQDAEISPHVMGEAGTQFKLNFTGQKEANLQLIEALSEEDTATEIKWIGPMQIKFQEGPRLSLQNAQTQPRKGLRLY